MEWMLCVVCGFSGVLGGISQQIGPWGEEEKPSESMLPICCACDWMLTGDMSACLSGLYPFCTILPTLTQT